MSAAVWLGRGRKFFISSTACTVPLPWVVLSPMMTARP
jgi:hypothetical protein